MRSVGTLAVLFVVLSGALMAQEAEKKGSFGIVIAENFVKFNYSITYLGDSVKPNEIAFRISFDDTKGYNLAAEIDESETMLKNLKHQTIQGKVERENAGSALLLFPKKAESEMKGKVKLYTDVKGYKLKKDFNI